MSWPTAQEFNEAIQSPVTAFSDPLLRNGSVECNQLGLPKPRAGNFATVYKITNGTRAWAVRCFNSELRDQEERYRAIGAYLNRISLSYMTEFQYLPRGIRLRGSWYPILKMEWVHGEPLNIFVERNLGKPQQLLKLAKDWVLMAQKLRSAGLAHGDLQHGNVLVSNAGLKLVDYDGMYVPELQGKYSNELGQQNYQLPQRKATDFGPFLDNFSEWVVLVTLLALSADPKLWQSFRGGDECLLFRKRDFEAPDQSQVFRALERIANEQVVVLVGMLKRAAFLSPAMVPPLDTSLFGGFEIELPISAPASSWLDDHIPKQGMARGTSSSTRAPASSATAHDWILDFTEVPVSIALQGNFRQERVSLLASVALVALAFLLGSWQFALLVLAIAILGNLIFLARSYGHLPEIAALTELSAQIRPLEQELNQFMAELAKLNKASAAITIKQVDELRELSVRRKTAEKEEQRREQGARDNSALTSLLSQKNLLEQRQLSELSQLQSSLGKRIADLKAQITNLAADEGRQLTQALHQKQLEFISATLTQYRLYDAQIKDIGPKTKLALHTAQVRNAADVIFNRWRVHSAQITPKRASAVMAWARQLETRVSSGMPATLSAVEEFTIRQKFFDGKAQLSKDLQQQEQSLNHKQQTILANYAPQLLNIALQMKNTQKELQGEIDRIRGDFKKVYDGLTHSEASTNARAVNEMKKLTDDTLDWNRKASSTQWQIGKLKREMGRYQNINFKRFLGRVAAKG